MFESFEAGDEILHGEAFRQDEVRYNLFHRIQEYKDTVKLKTTDGKLIFMQSKGFNPWLWVSGELEPDERKRLITELVAQVEQGDFPGITAEPETARLFAEAFCAARGLIYHSHMLLESYSCPEVEKPSRVAGEALQAAEADIPLIAEFMARFAEDAFGAGGEAEQFIPHAEEAVAAGSVYLWVTGEGPVSMATIAHRSARQGRVNDVYTPAAHRKHGYASALVAELSSRLLREGLLPVLYADGANPDSNKVYQSIGYTPAGVILDIKFN